MMRLAAFVAIAFSVGLTACAGNDRVGTPADPSGNNDPTAQMPSSTTPDEPTAVVYAHSDSTLYTVDPSSLSFAKVGDFVWPSDADFMTDIAVDRHGNMVGITSTSVYAIDKTTAKLTYLSDFAGGGFNGLSFIASSTGEEMLYGASTEGTIYKIDPMTGSQTQVGIYGNGWGSSGDIVSVKGASYATVNGALDATDTLVKIDPATGEATKIGDTGVSSIWGLGYWKQQLFGFTAYDGIVVIDVATGKASPVAGSSAVSWYGAGVTTAAPTSVN